MESANVKTVLLLSGGIDSTALAFWENPDAALTIDYGQVCAEAEVQAAGEVCRELSIPHEVVHADCSDIGSGSMSSSEEQLEVSPTEEWWPFRNQLIITLGAMKAVRFDASHLILGAVQDDTDHADGRVEFFESMDQVICQQEGGLHIRTPGIHLTSIELVQQSEIPESILAWAHSCHTSNYACGTCRGCRKYREVRDAAFS
jgi:7-cyano-7-deazaguanine synthase